MKIIPSIDILDGKVVRLLKGNYEQVTVYSDSALNQAKLFEQSGIKRIHIVDLLGSKKGEFFVLDEIKKIKKETDLIIQFGGGIRSFKDAENLFNVGIDKIVTGSLSVNNKPEFERICNIFSADKIIVAADVIDEKIAIKGWTENSEISINEHINYCLNLGVNEFLITDISKDGMLTGPAFDLYEKLQNKFPSIKLIASGGVSCLADLQKLKEMNLYAGIVGKAYYEKIISLEEMKNVM